MSTFLPQGGRLGSSNHDKVSNLATNIRSVRGKSGTQENPEDRIKSSSLTSDRKLDVCKTKGRIFCADWGGVSRSNTLLTVSHEREIVIWDARKKGPPVERKVTLRPNLSGLETCAGFEKKEGKRVVVGSLGGELAICDPTVDATDSVAPLVKQKLHSGYITHTMFVPWDSQKVVSCGIDLTIKMLDLNSNTPTSFLGHNEDVNYIAMHESHQDILASVSTDCTLRLWDPRTQRITKTYEEHQQPINAVAMCMGDLIATASDDGSCRLFDRRAQVRSLVDLENFPGEVTSISFSHSGGMLFANNSGIPLCWYTKAGGGINVIGNLNPTKYHKHSVTGISVSSGGDAVQTSADDGVRIWS